VVEQTTFNRLAEGSIPSALTITHSPSPTSHSFLVYLLLAVISDLSLLCLHDLLEQGIHFSFLAVDSEIIYLSSIVSFSMARSSCSCVVV
jgi:hypothetical protein